MNSRWKACKIGLVNFWYYDEQEFYFQDGRMLLRGANGSGKSVTMQSFIPLLLDGNMRPERLDPFGSRARKMENYLLEENDAREERTGYLYMEFKRQDSDTYQTIGIGLRARKNKKMDTWYFCISDGRRIGKDFLLYRESGEKIVYSRRELENRMGTGGRVFDSQKEYMECVNRQIFGFETMDEYREMIELLIQLRTPKLSKDFKPSIINDILSNSLQPLSEEDLRPMSEAIENMDGLKTNLDTLKDSMEAAGRIGRVYDRYNQIVLFDKAKQFLDGAKNLKELGLASARYDRELSELEARLLELEQKLQDLEDEQTALRKEEDSLNASDAKRLKESETELRTGTVQLRKDIEEKEQALTAKKDRRLEIGEQKKEREEAGEKLKASVLDWFAEMGELVSQLSFDEYDFMAEELTEDFSKPYGFEAHRKLLDQRSGLIETGIGALKEEERCQRSYDERLLETDRLLEERDKKERELRQYENQLTEIRNELKEQVFRWNGINQELRVTDQTMNRVSGRIEEYRDGGDVMEIRDEVRREMEGKQKELQALRYEAEKQAKDCREKVSGKEAELEEWKNREEPEPEEPEEVLENRRRLSAAGISYIQFYKTVDFPGGMKAEERDRLEEALLQMGILDALIVDAEDRDRVLALDPGACDRYIFTDAEGTAGSMMELLDIDNRDNDLLFYQKVSRAVGAIGYQGNFHTHVDKDGNYRLGVLSGTVTKKVKARFIGAKAREAYKQTRIIQLEQELEELTGFCREAEKKLKTVEERQAVLEKEWLAFPSGTDLKTAAHDCAVRQEDLERLRGRIGEAQSRLAKAGEVLKQARLETRTICEKAYLPARLEVFEEARRNLAEYAGLLTGVQMAHRSYLESMTFIRGLEDQLEDIDADMDGIIYDKNRYERNLKELLVQLQSVEEQLKLTNYEEIRERLDYCVERLNRIPGEMKAAIEERADSAGQKKQITADRQRNEENRLKAAGQVEWLRSGLKAEYNLKYVKREFPETENEEELADKVVRMFQGTFGNKTQADLFGDVQGAYHENRGFLLEYSLTLEILFPPSEDGETGRISMKRLDLAARYRGAKISFQGLMESLGKDMDEQSALLRDKDRELFEDILANTVSKKIRAKIYTSNAWVNKMNELMEGMQTSSGLSLSLRWRSKRAEHEDQLDTKSLVELLKRDVEIMREEEVLQLSKHFRSKIDEARKLLEDSGSSQSFHAIMREILDYRKWFEFQLECRKTGENKKELTDRVFFTFSGGEKAMAMYVPLFSAVVAKYQGARTDAPRLISLDEAFAGVDETNIKDMFRLMVEFEFDFIINSQILWGDYETVPGIAVYQLLRPENARFVTVVSYRWNGTIRQMMERPEDVAAG